MPASRGHAQFRAALRSAVQQDFDDFEVVVSDDSGELASVVEEVGDDRIRYFRNPRRLGLAQNHAAAFDRARGDLLSWLHDDDRLLPGFLRTLVPLFEDDPGLGVTFTACYFEDESGRTQLRRWPVVPGRHPRFLPELMRQRPVLPSTALVRAEVWRVARDPWPQQLDVADVVLWFRAAAAGYAFHYLDEPLAVYGIHAGQFTASEERFRDDSIRLFELFEFDDPEYERVRREQLAFELLLRAAGRLRQRRVEDARKDVERARALDSESSPLRRQVVEWLVQHPSLAPPVVGAWRRTRSLRAQLRRA